MLGSTARLTIAGIRVRRVRLTRSIRRPTCEANSLHLGGALQK